MNSVIVGLKSGEEIKLDDIDFKVLKENIDNFTGKMATFITFKDIIFVVDNIEYIKKV